MNPGDRVRTRVTGHTGTVTHTTTSPDGHQSIHVLRDEGFTNAYPTSLLEPLPPTEDPMTEQPEQAVAVRAPDPQLDRLARLGQWLAASEAAGGDERTKGASAALRFYYAEQLDLPATAVAELTVINGRLFVGAQLMRALAERNGYRVIRKESTDTKCVAALIDRENGQELGTSTFTIEQAQKAGLIRDRSPWKTHPARMLWARASKNVIVDFAPAVSLGIALDDEIDEYQGKTSPPPEETVLDEEADWEEVKTLTALQELAETAE